MRLRGGRELRDRINALENVLEKSAVVLPDGVDTDVFGIEHDELAAAVQQFVVRGGRVRGVRSWVVDKELDVAARRARRVACSRAPTRTTPAAARDHRARPARRRRGARDLARPACARAAGGVALARRAARRQGQGARDGDAQRQAGARALQDPALVRLRRRAATRSTTSRMPWGSTRPRCAWSATTSRTSAAPTSSPRWSCSRTACRCKRRVPQVRHPGVRRRHRGDLPGAQPPARAPRGRRDAWPTVEDRRTTRRASKRKRFAYRPQPDHRRRRPAAGGGGASGARRRRRQRHPALRASRSGSRRSGSPAPTSR